MNTYLDNIVQFKKNEVAIAKGNYPLSSLPEYDFSKRDFIAALQKKTAIIAEIKKASPSKGIICENFDVATIASTYARHGAACLSVLTDAHFFQGAAVNINIAKQNCNLPILRKDFIIDTYQINESDSLGADCILLIAAILDDHQLHDFCQHAQALDMAVLVEVHDENELARALVLPTPLIGINNRNLKTFTTNLNLSIELAQRIPDDKIIISESGISSRNDIAYLQQHGINTFLIGESLMRSNSIGDTLEFFING